MSLNDSINLLQEGVSKRGLIRSAALDRSDQKKYSLQNRLNNSNSIIMNDTIPYVPHDVYMAERTIGMDSILPVSNTYMKPGASVIKQKTDHLFEHFLTACQGRTNELEVFDLVQDLIQVCTDTFDDIVQNGGRLNEKNIFDGFGWLNQERNTWKLLHCLYKDRKSDQRPMEEDSNSNELSLHASEKEIIDKLYEQNENLREYQLIVDWLEQCASEQHFDKCRHFMDETISWENTLHQLQNVDRTVFHRENKSIVKKLDPDAPYRENLPLHDLDMEDEQRISREVCISE